MKKYGITKKQTWDLFDYKGLQQAVNYIARYSKQCEEDSQKLIEALTKRGVEIAKELVPVSTGELRDSIVGEVKEKEGLVKSTSDHSAFVEFGTGVVGKNQPYGGDLEGWTYDVNDHGIGGWNFFKDGRFYHTQGQTPTEFMLTTAIILGEEAPGIAKKVMGK